MVMRDMRRIAALALTISCGEDVDCSKSERAGRYWVSWVELSGDCGPVADELIVVPSPQPNCTIEAEGWTDDECTSSITTLCEYPDYSVRSIGQVTQEDDDGSRLAGDIEVVIFDASGTLCHSFYDVLYESE